MFVFLSTENISPPIRYADLPEAFKFFIEAQFRTIDVDGDGSIGGWDQLLIKKYKMWNEEIQNTKLKEYKMWHE